MNNKSMSSRNCSSSSDISQSIKYPRFDNIQLKCLPVDDGPNTIRSVRNACFARVNPTKVDNPRLVILSPDVLNLLDIESDKSEETNSLVEYLSGNKLWPGSDPASHCYCGYQFGSFAGQLGDGAAISLGEVVNQKGERWELQLKGSGLTPFSRQGDGRKVLRSSLREFLCSEAMHYLGIPTTRAGSVITSDTMVERDIFYTGDNILERASITSRVAKTFIRFGSFEISKPQDPVTGRYGPSFGNLEIVSQLTNFVIQQFYPHIWEKYSLSNYDDMVNCYVEFFKEVLERTAHLVALWQTVGFCHGVLNTDNMSIIGLTIDYGPFGFIDQFTWDHIPNTSDPDGRYAYAQQPVICMWNCIRLAECLIQALLDQQKVSKSSDESDKESLGFDDLKMKFVNILQNEYMYSFKKTYLERMRKKLGLLHQVDQIDADLVHNLLNTMEKTGADFTNTFLALEDTLSQAFNKYGDALFNNTVDSNECPLETNHLIQECCSLCQLQETFEPKDTELYRQLMARLDSMPRSMPDKFEATKMLKSEAREKLYKEIEHLTEAEHQERNARIWNNWLQEYAKRLKIDHQMDKRLRVMKSANPRIVLRNHLAEEAIKSAEKGDYTVAEKLFNALTTPYEDFNFPSDGTLGQGSTTTGKSNRIRPPDWSRRLRVSCSS
ncbi:unnamed protein product [Trichobilharzia szidati]|nr:unnamed protein product [Trichobilharzia szidati]